MVYKFENNKLNITSINNIKSKFRIWFWNKSVNKSDSNTKKDGYSDNSNRNKNKKEENQKKSEFKIQQIVSLDIPKLKLK